MNNTVKILAVDDDPRIGRLLRRSLTQAGFQVTTVVDGAEMRAYMANEQPDLVIMDLMLPNEDGFTLVRELRVNYTGAIIMLTGKSDPVDKVVGLELGADDYVTKPFDDRELLARVRSVLRRAKQTSAMAILAPGKALIAHFAGWQLDLKAYRLTAPDGKDVELTTQEFQLLALLVKRPNQVLDRDTILDDIAKRDYSPFDRTIDVLIGRLRKKIEPDPKRPALIKTIRGTGYLFTPDVVLR